MPRDKHKSHSHGQNHDKRHQQSQNDHTHHSQQSQQSASGGGFGDFAKDIAGSVAYGAGQAIAKRAVAYALQGASGAVEGASSGEFDVYLFAQSWAPRFCCSQKEKCEKQGIEGHLGLSTHGLWPSFAEPNKKGYTFPAFCQGKPKSQGEFNLSDHEWHKHGTCTVLSRDKYESEEHRVAEQMTVETLHAAAGGPMKMEEVRASFSNSVGLQLDDFCRLQEVTSCFAKEKDGTVGGQIDCPDHVMDGSRNRIGECQQVYFDKPGKCSYITKELLNAMKEV